MSAHEKTTDSVTQHSFDPIAFTSNMAQAAAEWQAILGILSQNACVGTPNREQHELVIINKAFVEAAQKLASDPAKLMDMQYRLWQDYLSLIQNSATRFFGVEQERHEITPQDRRFKYGAWQDSAVFDFIKQSYLLNARWLHDVAAQSEGESKNSANKVSFYMRQFVDAMSPSNFLLTNPEVLDATLDSNGENLVRGLRNMKDDLERGQGRLRIRMSDEDAFALGRNLALSKGKVVFQNDLMQLIQYEAATQQVKKTPILIIPAWINKFYIMDLSEENSFVRWLTQQGHTVFIVSWVNPDSTLARKTFENYMFEGPLAAIDAITQITGEKQVSAIGYCLGGTLLSITLAWLAAKGQGDRVASATYLTTMIDFSEAGELGVFIDEEQITALETRMDDKGYLEAHEMATTFNMLRANDLIWSFVVNNYLLGKDPFPFDLLYWNADATRMPAAMHSFYLRNMYLNNRLATAGGIHIAGVDIDVTQITTPTYILSCREDHIAPWTSTYAATRLYKGDVTFTLSASGHIAGVINPPSKQKYCYWVDEKKGHLPNAPEDWQKEATEHAGSWWPHWNAWQQAYANGEVTARALPANAIEDAPGSYVQSKS